MPQTDNPPNISTVRLPKVGGGDYRLVADENGWHVSVWTKGIGRVRAKTGEDMAQGPQALIECVIADCLLTYQLRQAEYTRKMSIISVAGSPGFRPGSRAKIGALLKQQYFDLVDGWYTAFAQIIKAMQTSNWPLDTTALCTYIESILPKDLA